MKKPAATRNNPPPGGPTHPLPGTKSAENRKKGCLRFVATSFLPGGDDGGCAAVCRGQSVTRYTPSVPHAPTVVFSATTERPLRPVRFGTRKFQAQCSGSGCTGPAGAEWAAPRRAAHQRGRQWHSATVLAHSAIGTHFCLCSTLVHLTPDGVAPPPQTAKGMGGWGLRVGRWVGVREVVHPPGSEQLTPPGASSAGPHPQSSLWAQATRCSAP